MLGLHDGSVVPADTLVELLWGEDPPRTAAKALQTHISSLRRILGDGFVLTQGAGWVLADSEVDASRYKSAARLGREAATAGDTSQAVARFEEALALWRGIPELPDGRRGTSEKTRWIEGHAALVEDRADALLATGRAAELIGDLEAAIADAPLRERRWGQLMLALYRAGRQGEALGAYQRARALLADELGVDPGPELRRLEAAIVAQDSSLDIAVAQHVPSVTRAVTFLLTDIEGSTAAWEADADAMAVALARHDELIEHVVTSRGGRLIKTRGEGDATFSVFERPSAAASAAVELQDAIAHEPWALREPIRIRVALHTGEVELRDGDYFGRAVNRVARLRSLAEGGQILCSGATAELVIDSLADDVVLTDLGMRQLRNLARPEHVFELRLETAEQRPEPAAAETPMERPGLPAVLVGPGPFVGRGRELEGLLSAWQSALAGGVRTVLIAGEPGVGKTRLAGEWSQRAYDQGAVVLYGRCDEDLGAPYQPFAEALRSLVPCMGADRLRGLRGVEALLPLVPGLTDVVPDLAPPSHADPDTERYALFDAVVALLEIASASAPVLLILDDLHWAAKPTLLLLRHLLRFGDHARVQIVGTYRSTDLDRSHPLAAMLADLHRDGTANRLSLGGLDEDDVTAYVTEAGYDDEELAHALASVTGGNPFFLIEALRHVDESGGTWDQSTLPQGVREAVSRRLSRLPVETNKALAAAAVVGSRFSVELVEQVVGNDLIDAFDEARKAGIVIEEPGGNYRFNHALVRQSLLAELASVRRMRLHQRIATILETLPGADDDLLAELAHHYFECAWAGNAAKAVFYCRRAADQAMARLAYEGAADLYRHALHALEELDDELPDRDDQAAELLVARCEALLAAGDVASAAGAVSQLRAATVDSARLAAWATCFDGQLSMLIHPERLDEVEAALGAAAAKLAELADAAGEAKAHTVRAGCLARLGRIADCEVALDDALNAARRAGEHRRVNAVLAGAPLAALWGPNPVPRAGGRCLDVVRLLRITTDSPAVEATSTRCQAVLEAFRGRAAAARRMIDSARRTVNELGLRHALLEVEQFAGIVELVVDDPAAAEPHLRKAYNGFRRMGLDADTAETAALLGRAYLALDRESEADELCSESERLAGHALKASIAWRTLRAHLLGRGGDYDAARRVAEAAVTLAERTDALVDHGDACLTLATVLGGGGNVVAARAAAEQAVELYERKGAAALAERARAILGENVKRSAPARPEPSRVELDNACVRAGERVASAINREAWDEFERLFAPDGFIESRRKIVGFGQIDVPSGEFPQLNRRVLEKVPMRVTQMVIAVRGERLALARLVIGADDVGPGAPQDEFLLLYGIDNDGQISLQVWFDLEDLDAAMAELDAAYGQFEEIHPRARLENAATRVYERLHAYFAARDWAAITELLTDDYYGDDRRSVVGGGIRRGPGAAIEDYRSAADIEVTDASSDAVATRGARLALTRARYSRNGQESEGFRVDFLQIVEIDTNERIAAMAAFDLDEFDAAIAELDARYLAGDAAPHARTWAVIARANTAFNRHEELPITPDFSTIDHRVRATLDADGLTAYLRTSWDLTPDLTTFIESVHRLSDLGVVVTHASRGTSQENFEAQWRQITLLTVDGDLGTRCEIFDEADVDAAIARFDELSRPAPRLENAASQMAERFFAYFAGGDWDSVATILADNVSHDDRRHVVNAGVLHGRDTQIANLQAIAEVGITNFSSTVIATRGARLALVRTRSSGPDRAPDGVLTEELGVVEINSDNQMAAYVTFDPGDFDSAIAELDGRYLAGEAASHAHTWSLITECYAAINRHERPTTAPDWINVDHRREIAMRPDDLIAYIRAGSDRDQVINTYVETVHRLDSLGAVLTYAARETSREGFDAEWRGIAVLIVERKMVNRTELFDENDLGAALARFEVLGRPAARLENAASRVGERYLAQFAARDWDAMAETLSNDFSNDDRRRVVGAGIQHGRDAQIADMRTVADLWTTKVMPATIATRGSRLVLMRLRFSGRDHGPETFLTEVLGVLEIDADERIAAVVFFDVDDFDAAIAELDARYLAGEAALYARAWQVIMRGYAAVNRNEVPGMTPDSVFVDHRAVLTTEREDLTGYLPALWDLTPDVSVYVEAVHRVNERGAVVTHTARGTSEEGFDAEWRTVIVGITDGNLYRRVEVFDEADLDAALARFDELHRQAPRLQNTASQVSDRFLAHFAARDWDAMAEMTADDISSDDRRRLVGAGVQLGRDVDIDNMRAWADVGIANMTSHVVATRGDRLFLGRTRFFGPEQGPDTFHSEVLGLVEIDTENRVVARVVFDANDLDAAFEELDARYLAGEAAAHAHTWSLLMAGDAALNRHQIPAHTQDWVNIDHRRATAFPPGDLIGYLRAGWDFARDIKNHILAVHRMNDRGAVVTHWAHGTMENGSDVEWREIALLTFEGDLVSRGELFDEADLDTAIARFEELSRPTTELVNAATRVAEKFLARYAVRDWPAMAELLADDVFSDDRRRVLNAGIRRGRDAELANWRATSEVWSTHVTSTVAIRGEHLALFRTAFTNHDQSSEAYSAAAFAVVEINGNNRIAGYVVIDSDELDTAIAELDARYLAREAAPYASAWVCALDILRELNSHDPGPMIERLAYTDHRRVPFADGDFRRAIEELWLLVPDARYWATAVHALDAHGVVASAIIEGTDARGNELQWARSFLLDPHEPRLEIYEESDVDKALARFEELRPMPQRLNNAATRVVEKFLAHFAVRDWDTMAELLADGFFSDDRRRVLNAGIRRGRDLEMANWRATADVWMTDVRSTVLATRGERLALCRFTFASQGSLPEASQAAALGMIEIDDDNRIVASVVFDPDDLDAALAELDARYLTGEASTHSHTWALVTDAFVALNQRKIPATTSDWVNIDHRRLVPIGTGDLAAYLSVAWELSPQSHLYVAAVHRLTNLGAVITHVAIGTSPEGFDAEWQVIDVMTFEGDRINRCELFDESDLDAALARFDELHGQTRSLENAASRAEHRLFDRSSTHDWAAIAEILAPDSFVDDRRRVVNVGFWDGRDVVMANMRALADGLAQVSLTAIATRGERLSLARVRSFNPDSRQEGFAVELLGIAEIHADGRIAAHVFFDVDDIDAAFEELDARYLAGEGAAHAHTWSVILRALDAFNGHELPATTPDWVNIDHRRGRAFSPGELVPYIRATWELAPQAKFYINTVHRLSNFGAVFTQSSRGASQDGFDLEWLEVNVLTVSGGLIDRIETFDQEDLDAALARFDELTGKDQPK
ncbi:BTAD domain-containing putative transcriptional regulator [Mycobacterium sp. WUMAC-067]|uniref:BTAD domain-containing putative transcriptional regulator n=1 Tax=unclassified Mycobacterium TaxID=2642494 RepID=UPI0035A920A8